MLGTCTVSGFNPSTWDVLYAKTKAARRRYGNFIGWKTGGAVVSCCFPGIITSFQCLNQ